MIRLGIIGCGNMGSAIARGILSKRILPFRNIYISDKEPSKAKELYKKFGINISTNEEIVEKCDFIMIAVKPQDFQGLLASISGKLNTSQHIISIMAGVTISTLERLIGKRVAITRAMPNMAAQVGKSITCLSHNKLVRDRDMPRKILSSVGEVMEIKEKHMNIVTALSGSGPAYFFYLVESLKEAGKECGLSDEDAHILAVRTLIGSAGLVDSTEENLKALRKRVMSKSGTTEAAFKILKEKRMKNIVKEAVKAAKRRAEQLSKGG